jgi:hypothetical protein
MDGRLAAVPVPYFAGSVVAGGTAGGVAGSVSGVGGVVLPGAASGTAGVTGSGITCGAEVGLGAVSGIGASAGFLQADRVIRAAAASRLGIFMVVPLQSIKIGAMQATRADGFAPRMKLEFIARKLMLLFATSPWLKKALSRCCMEIIHQGNIFHFLASNVR